MSGERTFVGGPLVPPDDVTADRAALLFVGGVAGAVHGEGAKPDRVEVFGAGAGDASGRPRQCQWARPMEVGMLQGPQSEPKVALSQPWTTKANVLTSWPLVVVPTPSRT